MHFNAIFQDKLQEAAYLFANPTKRRIFFTQLADFLANNKGGIGNLMKDFSLLFYFLKDGYSGAYPIAKSALIQITAAFIYLVSPIDLIPDFIPITGFTDDFAILAMLVKKLDTELADYSKWRKKIPIKKDA